MMAKTNEFTYALETWNQYYCGIYLNRQETNYQKPEKKKQLFLWVKLLRMKLSMPHNIVTEGKL